VLTAAVLDSSGVYDQAQAGKNDRPIYVITKAEIAKSSARKKADEKTKNVTRTPGSSDIGRSCLEQELGSFIRASSSVNGRGQGHGSSRARGNAHG